MVFTHFAMNEVETWMTKLNENKISWLNWILGKVRGCNL